MVAMMDLMSKMSPRAIANNIGRVSALARGRGSPQAGIRKKPTKVAKATRPRKRQLLKLSAMALLMMLQTGGNALHLVVDQVLKPVSQRGLGMLPFTTTAAADPTASPAVIHGAAPQALARDADEKPIPKIVVTSPGGVVTDADMSPAWKRAAKSSAALETMQAWHRSPHLSPLWRARRHRKPPRPPRMLGPARRQHRNQVRDPSERPVCKRHGGQARDHATAPAGKQHGSQNQSRPPSKAPPHKGSRNQPRDPSRVPACRRHRA
ncbi:hypothetical protein Trco_005176 [Trichoderma cornu-damae]|uniref:Uncharacterized protein n=1 Tax=Trichoderma cornu-damae TaxID=654480 RepID=A0A9P8TV49_9HYPO|nr:hypothetical protein Trco_005176 [Trichoderma cornu-damae]